MTSNDLQPPYFSQMTAQTEPVDGEKYLLAFRKHNSNHNRPYWSIVEITVLIETYTDDSAQIFLLLGDGDELDAKFNDADFYIHLVNE